MYMSYAATFLLKVRDDLLTRPDLWSNNGRFMAARQPDVLHSYRRADGDPARSRRGRCPAELRRRRHAHAGTLFVPPSRPAGYDTMSRGPSLTFVTLRRRLFPPRADREQADRRTHGSRVPQYHSAVVADGRGCHGVVLEISGGVDRA